MGKSMKKQLGILIILSLFAVMNCKSRHNINIINSQPDNNTQITEDKINNAIYLIEHENNEQIIEIEPDNAINLPEVKPGFSTFSELDINQGIYYSIRIDKIKIYENISKETSFIEITNSDVELYQIPESEDWLYISTKNSNINGFIFIYDISMESFYGNLEENTKSGNFYLSRLYKEYEIVKNNSNMNRYGPLLEFTYNDNVFKFWDSFTGYHTFAYHNMLLLEYYKDYNEILIFIMGPGVHVQYAIYDLQTGDLIQRFYDFPYFNESRDAVLILDMSGWREFSAELIIYSIIDNKYVKIIDEEILIGWTREAYWVNNDEFKRTYFDDAPWRDEETSGTHFIRRNNGSFDIIHEKDVQIQYLPDSFR